MQTHAVYTNTMVTSYMAACLLVAIATGENFQVVDESVIPDREWLAKTINLQQYLVIKINKIIYVLTTFVGELRLPLVFFHQ